MNTKTHTDIKPDHWIAKLPGFARPYAYLIRFDRPVGIWLLLLPGWWAILLASGGVFAMNRMEWFIFALFGVGAVVMRGAGCVVNDLWDRKLDRQVARTSQRPLAANQISLQDGLIFMAVLLLLGLAVLLQMNVITILLGVLVLPLIIIYPLMKRITWWPQAFLGLTFNFGALMGWSAVTGIVDTPAVWLYVSGIFWTLGYDTIYAHQDKEDDALAGVKSTALKLGDQSKKWVAGFYGVSFFFLLMAFWGASQTFLSVILLLVAAGHLFKQVKTWQPDDPQNSLDLFKSNILYGFLVFLAACL